VKKNQFYKFTTTLLTHCLSLSIQVKVKVKVLLRPTVSWPVRLGISHPSATRDQLFFLLEIFFRQLRVCYFVAPSLTRGRVCNLLLMLVLASAVPRDSRPYFIVPILETLPTWRAWSPYLYPPGTGGSEILQGTGFPFRLLLRFAGTTVEVFYPVSTRETEYTTRYRLDDQKSVLGREKRFFYLPYCGLPSLLQTGYRSFQRVQSAHNVPLADRSPPPTALAQYLHNFFMVRCKLSRGSTSTYPSTRDTFLPSTFCRMKGGKHFRYFVESF
jgi:hypothetical protein